MITVIVLIFCDISKKSAPLCCGLFRSVDQIPRQWQCWDVCSISKCCDAYQKEHFRYPSVLTVLKYNTGLHSCES